MVSGRRGEEGDGRESHCAVQWTNNIEHPPPERIKQQKWPKLLSPHLKGADPPPFIYA